MKIFEDLSGDFLEIGVTANNRVLIEAKEVEYVTDEGEAVILENASLVFHHEEIKEIAEELNNIVKRIEEGE